MIIRVACLTAAAGTGNGPAMTAKVALYRKLRKLQQNDLAAIVHVSQAHISRIENGDEGPPLHLFRKIASALNVSLSDLFADDTDAAKLILMDAYRQADERGRQLLLALAEQAKSVSPPGDQ